AQFYAAAQKQYFAMTGGYYALKFLSSPKLKDGLYWELGPDGIASPLGPLVERAGNLGYDREGNDDNEALLVGYFFRVLTAQGEYAPGKTLSYLGPNGMLTKGFGLIAYPSRYGVSGKMSFIVGKEGVVYSRNLGEKTVDFAKRTKRFDPDPSWH